MLDEYRSSLAHMRREPMIDLALHYHRIPNGTPEGGALTFKDMPFLVEIYRDMPTLDDMCAMKCTQVGWTEAVLLFMVLQARRGRRHAYVMPDSDLAATFVQERIQPMVERVPYYSELAKVGGRKRVVDNLRLRHIGGGSWRFLGSRQASKFREFTAESCVVDEYDDCTQDHLALIEDRLRVARENGIAQWFRIGNPKRSQGGISAVYANSDQRRWFHQCGRCGERQPVGWFEHVVEQDDGGRWVPRDRERAKGLSRAITDPAPGQDIRPVCRRCRRPWQRQRLGSCWVQQNPGFARRGYHVAQMDHLGRHLWGMFLQFLEAVDDPGKLAVFYGSVLGMLYTPKGSKLTDLDLERCRREDIHLDYQGGEQYRALKVVAGIDVGAVLNVSVDVVEERREDPSDLASPKRSIRRAVWVGAVPTWDELGEVLARYHVDVAVIDAEPEHHKAQEFRDWANYNTDTRVWLNYYHKSPQTGALPYAMRLKVQTFTVTVDKTAVMDATFAQIRGGLREWPADVAHVLHFAEHYKAPTRVLRPGGDGYKWDRGTKRDDYRQAECYSEIAATLLAFSGGYFEVDL